MQIPFVDLKTQYEKLGVPIDRAVGEVMAEAAFIGGERVKRFEQAFADYCGVGHCIGVGNGTDAVELILRALGLGPGDEVITATNTFIATVEAISHVGATPVLVDVDPYYHLDLEQVEAAITERTRAIIPVHLYGQVVDMDGLAAIARRHDLAIVEDACQAHGATFRGRRAGSLGRAAAFSFYPGKNLGAYGDAGAVVTDDAALAERVRKLANHGRIAKYDHDMVGFNSRLDGMQAAVLDVKLDHLEDWNRARRRHAALYTELLASVPGVVTPPVRPEGEPNFHLYVIRVPDRAGLATFLKERGIASGVHYPVPVHRTGAYEHLGYAEGTFPVAERNAREILSLPLFPELTREQVETVVLAIKEFVVG